MTSMTPSNTPTEVIMVGVANIRQDTSWPVDPALVMSFRASITRGEPPLLDLSLNRVRHADGSVELEVIDGMHRLEALRLEGVEEHSAKVREYSPQDAFYARIATSLGKPNELFRQRAERALREGFIRDVAAHLEGATVYRRGIGEDGGVEVVPRSEPLPADPLLALGTILWIHFAAKPEVTEAWEQYVVSWLDDIAGRLGKTPVWLRDEILDITALLGEDVPGKLTAERARLLLGIPDEGILRLVLARLKAEPHLSTTDLRFALDILGCGPDMGRYSWLKPRGLPGMRSLLAHASLSQLAHDYDEALRRAEAASQIVKKPPVAFPSSETPGRTEPPNLHPRIPGESSAHASDEHMASPAASSQVFGIVSPKFGGTGSRSVTSAGSPPSVTPAPLVDSRYQFAHTLTLQLIRTWHDFELKGGDWSLSYIRQDLLQLRTILEGYLRRANTLLPEEEKRPSMPRKETE
jgi:hypothetical protein